MRPAFLTVLTVLLALSTADTASTSATYVTAADVAATLRKMPESSVGDQQIRMVDAGGYQVGIGVVHRPPTPGQGALTHEKVTEVYYVLEGAGTLVTGGVLASPAPVAADSATVRELVGPSTRGTAVQSGESRKIAPGDVVIIPAGVPHGFSDVQGSIRYLVVRVDPARVLPTR